MNDNICSCCYDYVDKITEVISKYGRILCKDCSKLLKGKEIDIKKDS